MPGPLPILAGRGWGRQGESAGVRVVGLARPVGRVFLEFLMLAIDVGGLRVNKKFVLPSSILIHFSGRGSFRPS